MKSSESPISFDLHSLREELYELVEEHELQQLDAIWRLEDHLLGLRKSFQDLQLEFERLKAQDRTSKLKE